MYVDVSGPRIYKIHAVVDSPNVTMRPNVLIFALRVTYTAFAGLIPTGLENLSNPERSRVHGDQLTGIGVGHFC